MLNDAGAELGENFYIDSEKVSTRWLRTCDQIGLFLKILTTNVLSKVAQILKRWLCWTILKIGTFRVKLLRLTFYASFGKYWATFKCAIPGPPFWFIFVFSTENIRIFIITFLPMTRFKPRTSCIKSNCSANWAAANARLGYFCLQHLVTLKYLRKSVLIDVVFEVVKLKKKKKTRFNFNRRRSRGEIWDKNLRGDLPLKLFIQQEDSKRYFFKRRWVIPCLIFLLSLLLFLVKPERWNI